MSSSKSFCTSIHPASQNELDVLKIRTVYDTFSADTPKYVTMPFSGADIVSEWVTVAGALSAPVFLYVSEVEETPNAFAARLSAACKLPVLKASYAAVAEERREKAVENIISVFRALQNARIPAAQIILVGRARGGDACTFCIASLGRH